MQSKILIFMQLIFERLIIQLKKMKMKIFIQTKTMIFWKLKNISTKNHVKAISKTIAKKCLYNLKYKPIKNL